MSLITKAISLVLFFSFVVWGIAMLPDYDLPPLVVDSLQYVVNAAYWGNRYLPVDTAVQIFAAYLTLEFVIWLFKNIKSIIGYVTRIAS